MRRRHDHTRGMTAAALLLVLGAGCAQLDDGQVPVFEVDPLWPTPLEYPYLLGSVTGLAVDDDDGLLVVTRQDTFIGRTETGADQDPPIGECCLPSDPVLQLDADGNFVGGWGGPGDGYDWPRRARGIGIDPDGNVWIGGGVVGDDEIDSHILKFSRDGTFIAQFGETGRSADSGSMDSFGGAAGFAFDAQAGEVFVADGHANRRVAVLEIETGEILRSWGAYGNEPDDADLGDYDPAAEPAQQFRSVTCVELADDGLLYVCDRENNRIQVFETDGTFVTERIIRPDTRGRGSVWDVALSEDAGQRFLYVADGQNARVHVLDRESLDTLTSFGRGGRYPGHFLAVGSVAVDSQGNVYTGEDEHGKRVQKFANQGLGTPDMDQGPLWPEW